jgi:hypothetical protein
MGDDLQPVLLQEPLRVIPGCQLLSARARWERRAQGSRRTARPPPGSGDGSDVGDRFRLPSVRPDPDGLSEPGRPTQVAGAALADDEG